MTSRFNKYLLHMPIFAFKNAATDHRADEAMRPARYVEFLQECRALAASSEPYETRGRLTRAAGLVMEAVGLKLPVGAQVLVVQGDGLKLDAEVVGFSGERLFLMPTSEPQGLRPGAMVAAQEVLIPIQCEYYALEGLGQLLSNIELVQAHLNRELTVSTILLTMYDGRTKLADQVTQEVRNHFGDTVLKTIIPRSVKVSEAPGYGQTVLAYDPGSRGAMSYMDAAREVAERGATIGTKGRLV